MTTQDIQKVTFDRVMRGYNVDQVDEFLDKVSMQIEQSEKQYSDLKAQYDALEAKCSTLEAQNRDYADQEDAIKGALLNAQRMGESVIREGRQKADDMIREASIRAENIISASESQIADQSAELERAKREVAEFKSAVLSLYKSHIESLSTLPDYDEEEEQPADESDDAGASGGVVFQDQ